MAKIIQIKDNIIIIKGSEKFKLFQFFQLNENSTGFVLSAQGSEAKILVFGTTTKLTINQEVTLIAEKEIEARNEFFGNIINPFGEIILEKTKSEEKGVIGKSTLFNPAPSIIDRKPILDPLDTGIIAIDTMIPIGRGQRELIIGDRVTGKTSILINTIINLKDSIDVIYVSIGQKKAGVISLYETLRKYDVVKNTILIYANPDSAAEQFLSPMVGMAMAEAIAYTGRDVLIILDDLSKHANVYREISLSIDRNPGREAYPNDIFYTHSRLLERAGKFGEKYKNGSITALPVVETIGGDIASLIPSNIISITDGQIFTNTEKFNKGIFPAIDIQMSVSRTGSAVQSPLIKFLSKNLRADHARFEEIKKFMEMSIDMNDSLTAQVNKSTQLDKMLQQFGNLGHSREIMAFLVLLYREDALKGDFKMRDLAAAIRVFFDKDPVGIGIKMHMRKVDAGNEKWLTSLAKEVLPDLVSAVTGKFGKSISHNEWDQLIKDGE